ncbi:MAG: hypothetical protein KG075_07475 [Alphaproteobacteria bacterium]|nr:hypothetical protein [Alphaproteobacteria bacterium]
MNAPAKISLPHGLQQIADVAGVDVAVTLAMAIAPERLHVPKKALGSKLATIVGLEAANKIVAAYGGERIDIPLGKRALALHLLDRGHSVTQVGKLLKMARRSVQYLKNGTGDPDQLSFPV